MKEIKFKRTRFKHTTYHVSDLEVEYCGVMIPKYMIVKEGKNYIVKELKEHEPELEYGYGHYSARTMAPTLKETIYWFNVAMGC